MAKAVQRRRGTAEEHATFTGMAGEITVDLTNNRIVAHDGSTAGGHPAVRLSELPGLGGISSEAVLLTRTTANFTNSLFTWVNNGDGSGVLTVGKSILVRVWCQGGGGGGGGGHNKYHGGGGGASGAAVLRSLRLAAGQTIPVTFGAGGAGGVGSTVESQAGGSTGGTTSFGSLASAAGGRGAMGFNAPTASNGTIGKGGIGPASMVPLSFANTGEVGSFSWQDGAGIFVSVNGGTGGNSLFGLGGDYVSASTAQSATGNNGSLGGGGGGGAGYGVPCNGGRGGDGCIYIERII